jgi:hypothetical protein
MPLLAHPHLDSRLWRVTWGPIQSVVLVGEPILIAAMITIPPMRMKDWFVALAASPDQFRSTPGTKMLSLFCEREVATLRANSIFVGGH